MSAVGRFCCKSLFALLIKNSFGRRRDFRVKMWGTSLPEDKLAGDLGNVIGATSIGDRRSDFFTARKLAPGNLGLLQQYLPQPESCSAAKHIVRGRDASYLAPPPQIRTCGFPAYGSHLGYRRQF